MGLDREQFVDLIIGPTLEALGLHSLSAIELLLGTALQESRLCWLHQLGGGPALGVYQMEPNTHKDIWENYLAYRPALAQRIPHIGAMKPHPMMMVGNLWYATAMARIHYLRAPEALPAAGDLEGQAAYWKKYYNTELGAGTVDEYIRNWNRK